MSPFGYQRRFQPPSGDSRNALQSRPLRLNVGLTPDCGPFLDGAPTAAFDPERSFEEIIRALEAA